MKLNLPNKITVFRFFASFFLFIILIILSYHKNIILFCIAIFLFIIGAFSDFLDGYIARKYKLVTSFGRTVDPFADKILICGTFILLIPLAPSLIPAWFVLIVITRELGITALRSHLESLGKPFPAKASGKAKMLIQCISIPAVLFFEGFREHLLPELWWVVAFLLGITLFLTIISGLTYLKTGLGLLKSDDRQ